MGNKSGSSGPEIIELGKGANGIDGKVQMPSAITGLGSEIYI